MSWLQALLATQTSLAKGSPRTQLEGVVIPGSWNPATATCQVVVGDTSAFFADSGSQAQVMECTVKTNSYGEQYGAVGGERALVYWTQGGWAAELEHSSDDSPNAPSGEHWHLHADPTSLIPGQTPKWNSGIKLTNDGPDAADNLGGTHIGHDGALTRFQTNGGTTGGGHQFDMNQTTGQMTAAAIGATVKTIWDANGKAISHIVPNGGVLGLGALASSLPTTKAIFRKSDITTLVNNIVAQTLQTLATAVGAAAVSTNLGPGAAAFSALLGGSGWVAGLGGITPTIPSGSSIVRAVD